MSRLCIPAIASPDAFGAQEWTESTPRAAAADDVRTHNANVSVSTRAPRTTG